MQRHCARHGFADQVKFFRARGIGDFHNVVGPQIKAIGEVRAMPAGTPESSGVQAYQPEEGR